MKHEDSMFQMFAFEQEIDRHLTPSQARVVKLEEVRGKIKTPDGVWLSTPESRATFRGMGAGEQLYCAFGHNDGFIGSELEAMIEHLSPARD